ncbi:NADH dehydrogenase 1 alpha subcomplex assembly factor 3 [Trichonephila clavata]|uniref:NADH dehydrogenase [ubiquinone] 1 alpha subcomplex assembly factor 3 n=1 Tax=Trichonephila clavata TaxID=2740835 RepID=A0A8X6IKJ0_TRICU|nr:NADH dehydrogenase 1 alpha subcomplex assembly factor 3 [Trichonephila clavata]
MSLLYRNLFQLTSQVLKRTSFRNIATTKHLWDNYEGDGKTTVSILNREYQHLIMIDTVSDFGFRLNNGIFVVGPMAVFPRTIMQWDVDSVENMTIDSLSLFTLLEPKLDIFILGTGDKHVIPKPEILKFLKSKKISVEILATEKACATFNFLNVEGRCVAGAFLPPKEVTIFESELVKLQHPDNVPESGYIT